MSDDDLITLADACNRLFGGKIKVATLRAQIGRSNPDRISGWPARFYYGQTSARNGATMPRRKSAPRLYFDRARRNWVIRDGTAYIRTGCAESDTGGAVRRSLSTSDENTGPSPAPRRRSSISSLAYSQEHVPHKRSAGKIAHTVSNRAVVGRQAAVRRVGQVMPRLCRSPPVAARRISDVAGGYQVLAQGIRSPAFDPVRGAARQAGASGAMAYPFRGR